MRHVKNFKAFNEERTINDFEINSFVTWLDSNVDALAVSNIEATYTEYMKYKMTLSKQDELSYKQLTEEDKAAIEKELETRGMALSEQHGPPSSARSGSIEEVVSDFVNELFGVPNRTPDSDMAQLAKTLIENYNPKFSKFGIQFDVDKIDPVMVIDFMSDLESTDDGESDTIDVDKFKLEMSHWLV